MRGGAACNYPGAAHEKYIEVPSSRYESYVRISLGTMDEMARATQIFEKVLA